MSLNIRIRSEYSHSKYNLPLLLIRKLDSISLQQDLTKKFNDERISNMTALSNKVAIITGASSGIGYATSKLFATEGARVVVAARRQAQLDSLVDEISQADGQAVALAGDVKDEAFAKALVELAVGHFGGLDVAFNNAGTIGEMSATPDVGDWNG